MYRYEALSIPAFVQQLAVAYIARGYRFYVASCIPLHKDVHAVDRKLIDLYGLDCSKYVRFRQQQRGEAKVQYLRYRRFFVIIATEGNHLFREREPKVDDIRRRPIQCFGYSIGSYLGRDAAWHPSVRIDGQQFRDLKIDFLRRSLNTSEERLKALLSGLPFEPYAPVRSQSLKLLGLVNHARKSASLPVIPASCLRLRRSTVPVFSNLLGKKDLPGRPAEP